MKKSLLMLTVAVLLGLLVISGCKKSPDYAANGNWTLTAGFADIELLILLNLQFTGSETRGAITDGRGEGSGSYAVTDDAIAFSFTDGLAGGYSFQFVGNFTGDNTMSGTFTSTQALPPDQDSEKEGTWEAER